MRVGSPGDIGGTSQANDAQAAAAATGSNAPAGALSGTAAAPASAQANASATQTAPGNTNVVVRVASPGNNGPVTQQNTVGATAGTTLPDQTITSSGTPDGSAATDQQVSTSGSSLAGNVSEAAQSIDQSNNVTAPTGAPASAAAPTASPGITIGSANATQIDPTNMNVSVRIGSPGSDGVVTQANSATATGTSPDLSVVNVTGGVNTNVAIILPGLASGAPSSGPWAWNWTWDGDWTPPADATAADTAPTAAAVWNWIWTNDPNAAASQPSDASTATGATQDGMWTWEWSWTRADGQTWSWTWSQACACNWTWDWNWDWSATLPTSAPGAAATGTPTAPASGGIDIGAVTQSNEVEADALATASITSGPSLTQIVAPDPETPSPDGSGGNLVVTQSLLSQQLASALAQADQMDSWNTNVSWGVAAAPVKQSNTVNAVAAAAVDLQVTQAVSQTVNVVDGTDQTASADQSVQNTQSAHAVARASQNNAGNATVSWAPNSNQASIGSIDQENSGSAIAGVSDSATLVQSIGQLEDIGSATLQFESATQQLVNEQLADAEALVSQLHTWNKNLLLVPADSRATNPSLRQRNTVSTTSLSGNLSYVSQSILQGSGGSAEVQVSSALQQASVAQSALASSPASQTNLLNFAPWLGVEPPPPAAVGASDSSGAMSPSQATPISSEVTTISSVQTRMIGSGTVRIRGRITIVIRGKALRPTGPAGGSAPEAPGAPGVTCENTCAAVAGATTVISVSPRSALDQDARRKSHEQQSQQHPRAPRCACVASPGPAGSAPSGGGGAVGVGSVPYKFAAPAHSRPQLPTSILGRSMAFLDPLERPG